MRFYIMSAIVAAVVVIGFSGYRYVSNMQRTIAELQYNNAVLVANEATLRGAISTQENTIKSIERDNRLKDIILDEVYARFDETRRMVRDAEDRLNETNLSTLAQQNPEMVEDLINTISSNLDRCFEVATGSPLSEADALGNPECPALIPRTYTGPE